MTATLEATLEHAEAAYRNGESVMSDREFDALLASIHSVRPLWRPGKALAPSDRKAPCRAYQRVQHALPFAGLDKVQTDKGLLWWARSYSRIVVMPKCDGCALSLRYRGGKLVHALTRGHEGRGVDLVDRVSQVAGVPLEIDSAWDCEIRGELWHPAGHDVAASFVSRNVAPGDCAFVAWAQMGTDQDEDTSLKGLEAWGFDVAPWSVCARAELVACKAKVIAGLRRLPFPTDGVVVRACLIAEQWRRGYNADDTPRWSKAWKVYD